MEKSPVNDPFSIAMFDYRRVAFFPPETYRGGFLRAAACPGTCLLPMAAIRGGVGASQADSPLLVVHDIALPTYPPVN